uniref:Argininosuccinate synthase n=1 Tax=candidate division WOR-3 bacterium TaxID=2052148 RepID=A0A7V3RHS1_UNCW3
MGKVLLAYSGGLDTTVAIKMIEENYHMKVATLTIDVGQNEDIQGIRDKALTIGAVQAFIYDAKEEFAQDYILPALKANALYEGVYPLATALARPLMVKHLVRIAEKIGATHIAHGCTGKGNDQVRFECGVAALNPCLKVIAPVREFNLKRDYEIEYAKKNGIPVEEKKSVYSIDENLWGRSIECGPIEDETKEPPEDAFLWTVSPQKAPDEPEYIEIEFDRGIPVALNNEPMGLVKLINKLNEIGGKHGIGRIDHVESRLVGIKSHEVYEAPAATILIKAHQDLEKLVLTRDVLHFKPILENLFADLIYNGLWFSPLREAISAFIEETQKNVSGTVRVKLYKGSVTIAGRYSEKSLYLKNLATYEGIDEFDQNHSKGFIEIWSLPLKVTAMIGDKKITANEFSGVLSVQGEKL